MSILSPDQVTLKVTRCTESVNDLHGKCGENLESSPKQIEQAPEKIGHPVSIVEAYRYILARDGAVKYAEQVAKDALEAKNARDRLAATQEITDRVHGKAVQSIRHAGVFLVAAPNAEALAQLDNWGESE